MNSIANNGKRFVQENLIGVYLLAFMIPFQPKWYSLSIMILLLEQFIREYEIDKTLILKKLNFKNAGIWLVLFFLMHFVGLIHTENTSFAWMDIGMKASFILFPLYFLIFSVKINWKYLIHAFLTGLFLSIIVNFSLSFVEFFNSNSISHFFEAELTHLMHRSYWATYLSIGYIFLWYRMLYKNRKRFLNFLGVFTLFVLTLMTGAKIGLILLLIITLIMITLWFKLSTKKLNIIIAISGLLVVLFLVNLNFPQLYQRSKLSVKTLFIPMEKRDLTSFESTTARILMWDTATDLIEENFWYGVGTGDVKDELQKRNYEKGFTGVAEKNYNSHNQFLNTHVAIGFFSALFLFLAFLTPFLFTKGNNRFVQILVVLVLFLSLLPEAFLETQAGIIPVAFFLSLIGLNSINHVKA
ncbi:MAG: O-antigen ligase family protein [Brumimicrobium sp.]